MIDIGESTKPKPLESSAMNDIPIPLPRYIPYLDIDKANEWIKKSANNTQMRDIKTKVIANIQHIDFDQFRRNLNIATASFNKIIIEVNSPYCVLWDAAPHKSRRWVYQLSKKYLTQMPTVETYFDVLNEERNRKILQKAIECSIRSFVIFDDASYGGSQIGYNIEAIIKLYQEMGYQPPEFFLVVPYATNRAKEHIAQIEGARVTWVNGQIIPSLKEQLTEEEQTYVLEHHFQFTPYGYYKSSSLDRVTTFFDHCVPDMRSFDMQVTDFINRSALVPPYADQDERYYHHEQIEYDKYLSLYS